MAYDWDFRFLLPYAGAFARGIGVTMEISIASFVFGTAVGILIGVFLRLAPFRNFFLLINDAVRAVPMLVVIFFVYYFPFQEVFGLEPLNAIWSSIIAMSVSQAAYTADVVRAAVDGVSSRIFMGGRALGLSEITIWSHLALPDIFRQILPTEVAFFIGIVRLSSLASVIGAEDVVFVTRLSVSQNFRSLEAWIVVAMIYVVLIVPLTVLSRRLEKLSWLKRRW